MKLEERETILRNYGQVDFEDLLKTRLSFSRLPKNLYTQYLEHELRGLKRGEESLRKKEFMLGSAGRFLQRKDNCLELGCGMAGGSIVLSKIYKTVVGLDISEIDLLLAKKRLEENGIKNVKLVCGSAQNLPFKEGVFDLASATDVIEHMANQEIFLKEARRTLRNGGYFYFNSPNRFNIFGPEPHVRVWGVGFLPRRYMSKWVKIFKGVDYKGKRLLSYFELRRLLRKNYGNGYRIFGMLVNNSITDGSLKRRISQRFSWMLRWLNQWLKPLISQYHVVIFKEEG